MSDIEKTEKVKNVISSNLLELCQEGASKEIVQLFLDNDADINYCRAKDNETPLLAAIKNQNEELALLLIGARSELNTP